MKRLLAACAGLALATAPAGAEQPADLQAALAAEAQRSAPAFSGFSPGKARWPVRISNSTAPNDQISERRSSGWPRACSGDI